MHLCALHACRFSERPWDVGYPGTEAIGSCESFETVLVNEPGSSMGAVFLTAEPSL